MKKLFSFFSICTFASLVSFAQEQPAAAEKVLNAAQAKATGENKKVLLMFHASWCVWCRRMDSSLNDVSCRKSFDRNFVIEHITVQESKGKENLENPGGEDLMNSLGGKDQGLPYWVILNTDGKLLADSKMNYTDKNGKQSLQNTGCPASKEEVEYFVKVLQKNTSLSKTELEIIAKRFRKNEH